MKMNRKLAVIGLSVATSAMLFGSCTAVQNASSSTKGAVILNPGCLDKPLKLNERTGILSKPASFKALLIKLM